MWIVEYRELIRILTISDLKVKYQSSVLGFAWSLLNPLLMMLVLYLVFNNVFNEQPGELCPLSAHRHSELALFGQRHFILNGGHRRKTKPGDQDLHPPPGAGIEHGFIQLYQLPCWSFCALMVLLLAFGVQISANVLFFPAVHIIYFVMVYGISLALSSLYVYYRDLNQIWEVLLQLGFFISPVCYSISIVPENYMFYYMLNPVTLVMQIYRKTLLYGQSLSAASLIYILLAAGFLLILGAAIFKRLERRFAEEL